jgi:hypothetical protein
VAAIATAQVGDLVGPQSPNALTTVSTVNPILVNFTPTEQEYLNVTKLAGGEAAARKLDFGLVRLGHEEVHKTIKFQAAISCA